MNAVLKAAFVGTAMTIATVVGIAQTPTAAVTIVVESAERAYHVGDLIVLDVRVTNSSKQPIVFKESERHGWFMSVYSTGDKTQTDLLAPITKKNLDALAAGHSEASDDMGAYVEVKPGESHVFRVPIETAELGLQAGSYTIVVRRRDRGTRTDLVSPPFLLMLNQRPPQ